MKKKAAEEKRVEGLRVKRCYVLKQQCISFINIGSIKFCFSITQTLVSSPYADPAVIISHMMMNWPFAAIQGESQSKKFPSVSLLLWKNSKCHLRKESLRLRLTIAQFYDFFNIKKL